MGIVIITTHLRIATQIKRDNACWAWCLACSKGYEMLVVIMIIKHKLCEQPELSCIAGSNAKNDTATRGNVYQFLIKLHTDSSHNPAIPLLGIYPSEMKTYAHKNLHMSVYSSFIHHCSKLETTLTSFSQRMDEHMVACPCSGILHARRKKKWTADTCDSTDETQVHYAKWKKPDSKGDACMFPLTWHPGKVKRLGQKSGQWLPGVEWGMRELRGGDDGTVFGFDSVGGCVAIHSYQKSHHYKLNGWTVLHVNYFLMQKKMKRKIQDKWVLLPFP